MKKSLFCHLFQKHCKGSSATSLCNWPLKFNKSSCCCCCHHHIIEELKHLQSDLAGEGKGGEERGGAGRLFLIIFPVPCLIRLRSKFVLIGPACGTDVAKPKWMRIPYSYFSSQEDGLFEGKGGTTQCLLQLEEERKRKMGRSPGRGGKGRTILAPG